MEYIFDKVDAIIGITKISNSEILTPKLTVKDMVDLLSTDTFNPDAKFLESGRLLVELCHKLMGIESTIIICTLLLVVLGIILKLFVLGELVDETQVYCNASMNGQHLELQITTVESRVALRGWKFEQDGNTLLINARKVLASPLFNKRDYKTIIDLEVINNISFGDKEIWSNKT